MPSTSTSQRQSESITLRGVGRRFKGGPDVLEGIDLHVPGGQFLALLGPSGCGKSTLLRLIAKLDTETSGTLTSDAEGESHKAFVFQDPTLLPFRTAQANVALPLELQAVPQEQRRQRALAALSRVGLEAAANKYPAELSGGMRMRVSLARALVTEPSLLLLDEPFAALDELTRNKLDDDLRALWLELGMTVIFVTHSIAEALYLAERAVVLGGKPSRILLDHKVELPAERNQDVRIQASFAAESRVLYDALSGPSSS